MAKYMHWVMLVCFSSFLLAGEWHVDILKKNVVKFTSSTPILDFEGITNHIDGYIYWEGDDYFEKNPTCYFEVNLNSIETGNGKRDRDMRERLETHKWPYATFTGKFTKVELMDSVVITYRVVARGKMMIHGVEKEMTIPGIISIQEGNMYVVAEFDVKLTDFDIRIPGVLMFKVNNTIPVILQFFLKEANK